MSESSGTVWEGGRGVGGRWGRCVEGKGGRGEGGLEGEEVGVCLALLTPMVGGQKEGTLF